MAAPIGERAVSARKATAPTANACPKDRPNRWFLASRCLYTGAAAIVGTSAQFLLQQVHEEVGGLDDEEQGEAHDERVDALHHVVGPPDGAEAGNDERDDPARDDEPPRHPI